MITAAKSFRKKVRLVFISVICCGIFFNFIFDAFSYVQLKEADEAGKLVIHSHEVLHSLQSLEHAIELLSLAPKPQNKIENVNAAIERVKKFVQNPKQQELIQKVTQLVAGSPISAAIVVDEMQAFESRFLAKSESIEQRQNQKIEHTFFSALWIDALLLIALLILFLTDVKAAQKIERNLAASLNDLRDANSILYEEQLKRHVALKITVHDLKNPLGSIRGFAELISEGNSTTSVHDFSDAIKRISQNSLDLVETLLNNTETHELQKGSTNLISIINEVCDEIEVLAKDKGQEIIKNYSLREVWVLGNSMRLAELFSNLLSNAVKYSPLSAKITVRVHYTRNKIRVEVEDQGPGFSEQDRSMAFQFAQKLSARPTKNESSTGYGLFIAKQIVDLHDGQIGFAKTTSGLGGCVFFEIPSLTQPMTDVEATSGLHATRV